MGAVAQRAEPGDVIGMEMGVDGLDQPQIEIVQELDVAIDLLEYRVDNQRLGATAARDDVAVGPRHRLEQLPEDHGHHL